MAARQAGAKERIAAMRDLTRGNLAQKTAGIAEIRSKHRTKDISGNTSSPQDLPVELKRVRKEIDFTQCEFAPFIGVSVRTLSSIETGAETMTPRVRRTFNELQRLVQNLASIMPKEKIGPWLRQPNPAFDGYKPLELLDRGEADRIYAMIYMLKAGIPG